MPWLVLVGEFSWKLWGHSGRDPWNEWFLDPEWRGQ